MVRAAFLDRDGTVIEEVGYLSDIAKLRLISGAGAAIKRLNDAGLKVILVTNQSGVARGYFPESFVHEAHDALSSLLKQEGAHIDAVYYCPHHPKAGNSVYNVFCECRKPGTGMVDRAAQELGIDVKRSFVVGDKWVDVELGQRAGAISVLVQTGFAPDDPGNIRPAQVREPDFTAHSIVEAAEWIVSQIASGP